MKVINFCFLLTIISVQLLNSSDASPSCVGTGLDAFASLGGSCSTYSDQLPDGSLGFCAGLVTYPYFLPSGVSQQELEVKAATSLAGADPTGGALLGLLPPRCSIAVKETTCAAVFQRCELVDDFFLDSCSSCNPATTCDLNGQTFATCANGNANTVCGVQPGGPLGLVSNGNAISWATVFALNAGTPAEAVCASFGLVYVAGSSAVGDACMRAIPRSPCKAGCDVLHDQSDDIINIPSLGPQVAASCPLISGYFYGLLRPLFENPGLVDPYVHESVSQVITKNGCDANPITQEAEYICNFTKFNVNMFSILFGAFPSCSSTIDGLYLYGKTFTVELFRDGQPRDENISLGAIMSLKASVLVNAQLPCAHLDAAQGFTCADYINKAKCFSSAPEVLVLSPQPTFAFASPATFNDVCAPLTRENNDTFQLSSDDFGSIFGNGLDDSLRLGLRFVAPALGMPLMASAPAEGLPFLTQPNKGGDTPLCSFQIRSQNETLDRSDANPLFETVHGTNAHECAHLRIESVIAQLPPWVALDCQVALRELACRSNELKMERRSLCLLSSTEDCAATDVAGAGNSSIPFVFLLPRFPSSQICENVHDQCAPFIDFLATTDPAALAQFNEALSCDRKVGFDCAKENTSWNSAVWPCSTPFDGLAAFPADRQFFFDSRVLPDAQRQLFSTYLSSTLRPADYLEQVFSTEAMPLSALNPYEKLADNGSYLEGMCRCPYPLQVPDNPLAGGIDDFVCCDQPCVTTTFTDDEITQLYEMMVVLGSLSLVGAWFVAFTWITFRSKRMQYLTLYFTMSSSVLSIVFVSFGINNLVFLGDADGEPTAYGHPVLCNSNTEYARAWNNFPCAVQSIGIFSLSLVASSFWFCQALDLYLRLVRGMDTAFLRKYYIAYSIGMPTFNTVITLVTDNFGYSAPLVWCFVAEDSHPAWDFSFFYGPIFVMLIVGVVLIGAAIRVLLKHRKTSAHLGNQHVNKMNQVYYSAAVFVVLFSLIWAFVFSFRVDLEFKRSSIEDAAVLWASCLLANFANGIQDPAFSPIANNSLLSEYREPGTGCGFQLPVTLDLPTFRAFIVVCVGQGIVLFFIFGLRKNNFKLWKKRVENITLSGSSNNVNTRTREPGSSPTFNPKTNTSPNQTSPSWYRSRTGTGASQSYHSANDSFSKPHMEVKPRLQVATNPEVDILI